MAAVVILIMENKNNAQVVARLGNLPLLISLRQSPPSTRTGYFVEMVLAILVGQGFVSRELLGEGLNTQCMLNQLEITPNNEMRQYAAYALGLLAKHGLLEEQAKLDARPRLELLCQEEGFPKIVETATETIECIEQTKAVDIHPRWGVEVDLLLAAKQKNDEATLRLLSAGADYQSAYAFAKKLNLAEIVACLTKQKKVFDKQVGVIRDRVFWGRSVSAQALECMGPLVLYFAAKFAKPLIDMGLVSYWAADLVKAIQYAGKKNDEKALARLLEVQNNRGALSGCKQTSILKSSPAASGSGGGKGADSSLPDVQNKVRERQRTGRTSLLTKVQVVGPPGEENATLEARGELYPL